MQFLKSSLDKYDLRDYLMIIVGTLIYGFGFTVLSCLMKLSQVV